MVETVEAIVIGAGVVGIAVARALARAGIETIIVEKNTDIGQETSSRNSEVIHAGVYYTPGGLKAELCVEGKNLLYMFCDDYNVQYKKCGKLIVANSEEQELKLDAIKQKALDNGVKDLRFVARDELRQIAPPLLGSKALFSPSTGIVDSHGFMYALLGDAQLHGAILAKNTEIQEIAVNNNKFVVSSTNSEGFRLVANYIVNCGGLSAQKIASQIVGFPRSKIPKLYYAKGNYFSLNKKSPFRNLIYPIPEPGGLGIHLTLDLMDCARFGPDVQWVEKLDYRVDELQMNLFYERIRDYWPDLPDDSLAPAYSGIRPKIIGPGGTDADFIIQDESMHGVRGLINLFGIESPGLTSSIAIGSKVLQLLFAQR